MAASARNLDSDGATTITLENWADAFAGVTQTPKKFGVENTGTRKLGFPLTTGLEEAIIQNGQLADIQVLEYPNHRQTSVRINNYALPYLRTEAIQAQSAYVDVVSGATLTSEAFAESLQSALSSAKQ